MRRHVLVFVVTALAAFTSQALAYDATQTPRYGSPPFYRPEVDALVVHGSGSTGDISGMSLTAPGAYGASMTLGALFKRSTSIRDIAGVDCTGAADSSAALAAATLAVKGTGTRIDVDGGCRLLLAGAAQVWLKGVAIEGPGTRDLLDTSPGSQGGTVLLTDRTRSPFVVSNAWSLRGLKFYWPDQTEAAAATNGGQPIAFPPLIGVHGSDQVYSWAFQNNQVVNAYDVADLTASPDVGHGRWTGNQQFAMRYHLRVHRVGGETWVTDNQFSFVADYYAAAVNGGVRNLIKYASGYAEALRIDGTGTAAARDPQSVDGLRMSNNYALALRYFVRVVSGTLNLATLTDNGVDQVGTYLSAEAGGVVLATQVTGGSVVCENFSDPSAIAPCFSVEAAATPVGSELALIGVNVAVSYGPGVVFKSPGGYLRLVGGAQANIGNLASTDVPVAGIIFASPNGDLTVTGVQMSTTAPANVAQKPAAIDVQLARQSTITGSTFWSWGRAVNNDNAGGVHAVNGNVSLGSTGTAAVSGVGFSNGVATRSGNRWDMGPPDPVLAPVVAPASATAPCLPGQVQVDAAYVYTCVAANTWRRTPVGTAW